MEGINSYFHDPETFHVLLNSIPASQDIKEKRLILTTFSLTIGRILLVNAKI
jgi:hypothetical protein